MADAESVIAELKNLHALDRVRCRGTPPSTSNSCSAALPST
jgi:hypothetical protein